MSTIAIAKTLRKSLRFCMGSSRHCATIQVRVLPTCSSQHPFAQERGQVRTPRKESGRSRSSVAPHTSLRSREVRQPSSVATRSRTRPQRQRWTVFDAPHSASRNFVHEARLRARRAARRAPYFAHEARLRTSIVRAEKDCFAARAVVRARSSFGAAGKTVCAGQDCLREE